MVPHVNSSMTSPIASPYMILLAVSIGTGFILLKVAKLFLFAV